jgi:Zn-dependent protease
MNPEPPVFTVEPPQGPRGPRPSFWSGWLPAAGIVLLKYKSFFSILLSLWLYWLYFGWSFAVGIVLALFVHEMGHVIVAKMLGMPVSAPLFIPFLGAAVFLKQNPRDAWTGAVLAAGGPLAGGLGGWACLIIGQVYQVPVLIAIALISFVINLINMIPLPPLDGGGICAAVSRWFWLLGLILLGAAVYYFHAWTFTFIGILVLLGAYQRVQQILHPNADPELEKYYQIKGSLRVAAAFMYLGIIILLLLGCLDSISSPQLLGPNSSMNNGT